MRTLRHISAGDLGPRMEAMTNRLDGLWELCVLRVGGLVFLRKIIGLRRFTFFLLILLTGSIAMAQVPPKREFRAAWVVTLANLDWPSRAGMHSDYQKEEFRKLLDKMQRIGLNALIVQVRPAGDAFYPSSLAPWSQYISGQQGQPPFPFYDPLQFMIEECHARNMEFHAWFNPFRALSHNRLSSVAADNVIHRHPDWFYNYGDSKYFDPGVPAAREYLVKVIMEVVKKYDINGVHLDDYFYPYPIAGKPIPDNESYQHYGAGFASQAEWRRYNVDRFVQQLADSIYLTTKHVKFGISPFGIWRNQEQDHRGSMTIKGLSAYDELYADTRKWVEYGWVDYMAPQLYWAIGHKRASFSTLMDWWKEFGEYRHIYIGHAPYLMAMDNAPAWAVPNEFMRQVDLCRAQDNVHGNIWFRASTMQANPGGLCTDLCDRYYQYPALIPAMPWLDSIPPERPRRLQCQAVEGGVLVNWAAPMALEEDELPAYYVVYRFPADSVYDLNDPRYILALRKERTFLDLSAEPGARYCYAVTSVDRMHNESVRFVYQKVLVPAAPAD